MREVWELPRIECSWEWQTRRMLDSTCFVKCPGKFHHPRRCWGGTSWKGIWQPAVCWDTLHWTPELIWKFRPTKWLRPESRDEKYLKSLTSKGVSWGPKMTAFQSIMLFSVGAPLTPAGGSSWVEANSKQQIFSSVLYLQSFEVSHQTSSSSRGHCALSSCGSLLYWLLTSQVLHYS